MPISHILLAVLVMFIWGVNFVAIKLSLIELTPLVLCFYRFLLASIPAIFFVRIPKAALKMIFLYSLLMFVGQFSLLFTSMQLGVSAGLAAILLQLQLFFTIFFAVFLLGEKPKSWQIIGAVVSFSGIAVVLQHTEGSAPFIGFIMVLIAAMAMGLGNLVSKMIGKVEMTSLIIWSSLVSCPVFFVLAIYVDGVNPFSINLLSLSATSILSMFYTVYASTLLAYTLWSWLLSKYPVAIITPFSLLAPIFAMASSSLLLGETLEPWKVMAGTLVISGIGINILGTRYLTKFKARAKSVPVAVAP